MKGHKKQRCEKTRVLHIDEDTKYTGSVYDNKPSGHGILQSTEVTYEGYFLNGKRHGYGCQTFVSGRVYEGEWSFDLFHGKGKLISETGNVYEGSFHTGTYHGYGCLTKSDSSYQGQWNHGTFHGQGIHKTNLGTYQGSFRYNLRHGRGKWTDSLSNEYNGEWNKGLRSGYGVYTTALSVYKGFWAKDLQSGRGEWTHKLRGRYDGEWKRGKRHNKGTHVWPDGTEYSGGWSYGKRTGHGILKWTDGSFYKGFWLRDEYNGSGVLSFNGKSRFVGNFSHNSREGIITEFCEDGQESTGPWVNDLRHGTFQEDSGRVLYIWNRKVSFDSLKKAERSVSNLIRKKDYDGARVVLEHHSELICWETFWKHDHDGYLVCLLKPEAIIETIQKKAWKLFRSKRYTMLENLVKQCPHDALEKANEQASELFDSLSHEFTANPWMVRDQSYSKTTRKELLRGLFLGEFGRCDARDPFTRLPLTKRSGKYLSKDRTKAKEIYTRFMKAVNAKPTIRELAVSFELQDFEELLKNAREANDRETIRRIMKDRNEYIKQTKC